MFFQCTIPLVGSLYCHLAHNQSQITHSGTGMKKESAAIKRLRDHKSKVSSHYFIKNNGEVLSLVPDLYGAWHAGVSSWQKLKSLNKYSIGIENHPPANSVLIENMSQIIIKQPMQ